MNDLIPADNGHRPVALHPEQFPQPATPLKVGAIAKALATAQQKCKPVEKDARNTFHKYSYASAEAILAAAQQALAASDLAVVCSSPRLTTIGSGSTTCHALVRNVTLIHSSGEYLPLDPLEWPVIPDKGRPLDKAFASAITSSLAYLLRDLLLMPRVDPEDEIAGRDDREQPQAAPAPQKPAPAKPAPAAAPKLSEYRDGAEFEARLIAYDKKMAAEGLWKQGDLQNALLEDGVQSGYPAALVNWPPHTWATAGEFVRAFVAHARKEREAHHAAPR